MGENMMVFVSDIHLKVDNYGKNYQNFCAFLRFLIKNPPEKLYILGDLLDGWYHNDYINTRENLIIVRDLFRELSITTNIFLMRGNHDFIIDDFFCKSINATFIKGRFFVVGYNGRKLLLTHGDLLFRISFAYRISLIFQSIAGFASYLIGGIVSEKFKSLITNLAKSKRDTYHNSVKSYKLEIDTKRLNALSKKYNSDLFIFGHSHNPSYTKKGCIELYNLGSWDKPTYLEITDKEIKLLDFT